jgi:hypothetical protein
MIKKTSKQTRELTGRDIDAMSDAQRQALVDEIASQTPQQRMAPSRPLNKRERADFERRRKVGRPRFGRAGVKVIALSVEKDLLQRADTYAKSQGLKRAELFTKALNSILPKAG